MMDDPWDPSLQKSQGAGILLMNEEDEDSSSRPYHDIVLDEMTPRDHGESPESKDDEDTSPKDFRSTARGDNNEDDLRNLVGSAPPLISSSPVKKVQFELGGGEDESSSVSKMTQSNPQLLQPVVPSGESRSRAEIRDYGMQPSATIALLPAIAEERHGGRSYHHQGGGGPGYHKSVSMIETSRHPGLPSQLVPPDLVNEKGNEMYGFVELDVLWGDGEIGAREWKETARWIKYEENLEEGSDRWGRPHIASLSFHSLIKLRQLIERDGIILLDLEERDMPGVAYRVVEELSAKGIIRPDESPLLMRALLLKHRHVNELDRNWFGLRRINTASVASLTSLYNDDKGGKGKFPVSTDPCVLVRRNSSMVKGPHELPSVVGSVGSGGHGGGPPRPLHRTASGNYLKPGVPGDHHNVDMSKGTPIGDQSQAYCPSEEDLKWIMRKETMRRLLPSGAEATMIMVGDFEALRKPIFVFVRLAEPAFMFNVTEIPVPVRFFSILLVPPSLEMDIIEIGRSFGALMSNKHFNEVALRANGRKSLLSGINEFLDDSIVLPPGDWDNHDLLPLHVLQAKSKAIRIRRLKKQFSFVKSNESFVDAPSFLAQATDDQGRPEKEPYDPFKRTKRPFGGLVNDIKKRYPYYISDFKDALNFQCFSTIVFMYFASIGLIITFAGLMGEKTHDLIGMSETLTATSIAGIFYSLVAGQPLIPMGPTGALLVFDEILYNFCVRYEIEFLPLRAWISVWLFLITLLLVAVEGCVLVKWFTKFTQDIFAALTALLLIFESLDNLSEIYETHPLAAPLHDKRPIILNITTTNYSLVFEEMTTMSSLTNDAEDMVAQPNTALLSTILMLGTFFIGYFLKEFRNSVFLGEKARRALGDFGVPIAILTMVFLDFVVTDTYTQKVKVPQGFQPSSPDKRGWLINPLGMERPFGPLYIIGALAPALLLFILIFMSQQICELLVNSKERKLVKGSGFHFDLFLVALINIGSGFFGAPWLCCATVRAIGHVTALTVYSKNNPPGEKPSIVKVHEQRVTNLAVSILVGCSVLLSPLLAFTPMAVLFGVFLYMGVTSLSATQLFERFSLFFIPVESHPQTEYVRRVKTWKMHLYTLIQISCLALLWAVKSIKQISLAFPFFLLLLVPVRLQLERFYNESELQALDGAPLKKKSA